MRAPLALGLAGTLLLSACAGGRVAGSISGTDGAGTAPVVAGTTVTTPAMTAPAQTIPTRDMALAAELDANVTAFAVDPRFAEPASRPVVGVELLTANSNRGPALLDPSTLPATKLELDRLHQLGVQGVTVAVKFPVYSPEFAHFADYRTFYRAVAAEVRARGMKLDVEAGAIFTGTPFSPVKYDYSGMTMAGFAARQHALAQTVIDDMHPDWLTILAEPDTEAALTGIKAFATPDGAFDYVTRVLIGLRRGSTSVGAGTGTWLPTTFAARIVTTSVDYLDLHLYPVNSRFTDNAAQMVNLARAAHKAVVLDEAWLYKTASGENLGGVAASPVAFARDAGGYWAPLDQRFLQAVDRFARAEGIVYESFFWSGYLFSYAPAGTDVDTLSFAEVARVTNKAVYQAMLAGRYTDTGRALGRLAA